MKYLRASSRSSLTEESHVRSGNSLVCLSKHFSLRLPGRKIPGQRAKLLRKFVHLQYARLVDTMSSMIKFS